MRIYRAGSKFADQMMYLQRGIGAIARTVQDRLRDKVSVLDFGAVGDGVTNDAPAIQKAIDMLGTKGGMVFFPVPRGQTTAVYAIAAPLRSGNDIHFRGEHDGAAQLK